VVAKRDVAAMSLFEEGLEKGEEQSHSEGKGGRETLCLPWVSLGKKEESSRAGKKPGGGRDSLPKDPAESRKLVIFLFPL